MTMGVEMVSVPPGSAVALAFKVYQQERMYHPGRLALNYDLGSWSDLYFVGESVLAMGYRVPPGG